MSVIVFRTEQASAHRVELSPAMVRELRSLYPQLVTDDILAAAGAEKVKGRRGTVTIPLSACRFTGGSASAILAAAQQYAKQAGVTEKQVGWHFVANTKALRMRTVPFGTEALRYLRDSLEHGAIYSEARGGIVRAPRAKAPKAKASPKKATPKASPKKATRAKK